MFNSAASFSKNKACSPEIPEKGTRENDKVKARNSRGLRQTCKHCPRLSVYYMSTTSDFICSLIFSWPRIFSIAEGNHVSDSYTKIIYQRVLWYMISVYLLYQRVTKFRFTTKFWPQKRSKNYLRLRWKKYNLSRNTCQNIFLFFLWKPCSFKLLVSNYNCQFYNMHTAN